jgi:pyruvate formate lyase activating enzyme
MKVYHIVYEPTSQSVDIHFWTVCNLKCRACYTRYEILDFGLFDDPIARIAAKTPETPPTKFLSYDEVMAKLEGLAIKSAVLIGTEPVLDPEMPRLAAALQQRFGAYNILLTNGFKNADLTDIDEVIFSLKAATPSIHLAYTGVDNSHILANFRRLYESGKKMQSETVFIPGLVDAAEIEKVARFIASVNPDIPFRVDAYFPVPSCPWRAATREEVEAAAELARKYVKKVNCLTLDMKRTGDKPLRIV